MQKVQRDVNEQTVSAVESELIVVAAIVQNSTSYTRLVDGVGESTAFETKVIAGGSELTG